MEFSRTVFSILHVLILYAECDLSGFKELAFGKRRTGALIDAIYKVSFLDCVKNCIGRKRCVSVNYQRKNLLCELNYHFITPTSDAMDGILQKLKDEKTFVFTDMRSWDKRMAGSCSEKPCKVNEKCVPKSFTDYECKISDCGPLPDMDNTTEVINTSSLVKIGVGARRFFTCEQWFLPRVVVGLAICMSDGKWQGPNIECLYHTCQEILNNAKGTTLKSGVYTIYIDNIPKPVWCDMETDGGGWTVIQRRQNGHIDFYRSWNDYKIGFGNAFGEYWIGNDALHLMTSSMNVTLRVDLEQFNGTNGYGIYSTFQVDTESNKYRLRVGGYNGNINDCLRFNDHKDFSTKDRDNDLFYDSCAIHFHSGWWHWGCTWANFNGQYYTWEKVYHDSVYCYNWTSSLTALKRTKMMIR